MDTLSGAVERITYYNPENGYTVLRLRPDNKMANCFTNKSSLNADGLSTVVGSLPELSPGEHLRLQGQWDNHPKHGPQFKAEVCEQTLPATVAGIQGYLGSGMRLERRGPAGTRLRGFYPQSPGIRTSCGGVMPIVTQH
jgi:exodeoxyribonuclease V alpha subunit